MDNRAVHDTKGPSSNTIVKGFNVMGHSKKHGLANAVTVRIWYPSGDSLKSTALSKVGVGHASLTVKLEGVRHYITWQVAKGLPNLITADTALDYTTGGAYIAGGQMCKAKDESWMSSMTWGQMNGISRGNHGSYVRSECNWKIRIKTLQPDETGTGLNADDIISWWERRVANDNVYKLASTTQNCTGCVAEALKAGGLKGSPSAYFALSADDLRVWVEGQIVKQNLQLNLAEAGFD